MKNLMKNIIAGSILVLGVNLTAISMAAEDVPLWFSGTAGGLLMLYTILMQKRIMIEKK